MSNDFSPSPFPSLLISPFWFIRYNSELFSPTLTFPLTWILRPLAQLTPLITSPESSLAHPDFVTSSIHMSSHPDRRRICHPDFVTSSIHMSFYPEIGPICDSDFVTSSIRMSFYPYRGPNFDYDFVTSSIDMSSYPYRGPNFDSDL